MAISIGDALLKLGVDKKDFDRDMNSIRGNMEKHRKAIGMAMIGIGTAVVGMAAKSIKAYASMGDEVQKMALRTGFTTEALSELRHAAEISGSSLGSLEKGVKKMSMTISDARDGLMTYTREFDKIGMSVQELDDLSPEEQFFKIAEAIASLEDPTQRAASAQKILGRAGTELLPLFAEGAEGMAALRQEAHELGIVFNQEAANSAARFTDNMTRLKRSMDGVKFAIAESLIPALEPLILDMTKATKGIAEWVKENQALSLTVAKGGVMMIGLGTLLLLLPNITAVFKPLIAAIAAAGVAFNALFVGIGMVGFGIIKLMEYQDAHNKLTAKFNELEVERQKYLAGTINRYTEVAQEYLDMRVELAAYHEEVTREEEASLEALRQHIGAVEEQREAMVALDLRWDLHTESILRAKAALVGETDAQLALNQARMAGALWMTFPGGAPAWTTAFAKLALREGIPWEAGDLTSAVEKAIIDMTTPMQNEGIAMRPMLASIAEKKPEAVLSIERLERMVGVGRGTFNVFVELDGRTIARAIGLPIVDDIRLKTGVHI